MAPSAAVVHRVLGMVPAKDTLLLVAPPLALLLLGATTCGWLAHDERTRRRGRQAVERRFR